VCRAVVAQTGVGTPRIDGPVLDQHFHIFITWLEQNLQYQISVSIYSPYSVKLFSHCKDSEGQGMSPVGFYSM
jgi:hypothetical protein